MNIIGEPSVCEDILKTSSSDAIEVDIVARNDSCFYMCQEKKIGGYTVTLTQRKTNIPLLLHWRAHQTLQFGIYTFHTYVLTCCLLVVLHAGVRTAHARSAFL